MEEVCKLTVLYCAKRGDHIDTRANIGGSAKMFGPHGLCVPCMLQCICATCIERVVLGS